MKTIQLEMPDQLANLFEGMTDKRKVGTAMLAAFIAQAAPQTLDSIFAKADKRVALSGLTEEEIDKLLNEIS
jgi:hypothetical protein